MYAPIGKHMQAATLKLPVLAAAAEDSGPSDMVIFGLIGVIIFAFIVILVLNKVIGTLRTLTVKKQRLVLMKKKLKK